jgi:hypothetical protein
MEAPAPEMRANSERVPAGRSMASTEFPASAAARWCVTKNAGIPCAVLTNARVQSASHARASAPAASPAPTPRSRLGVLRKPPVFLPRRSCDENCAGLRDCTRAPPALAAGAGHWITRKKARRENPPRLNQQLAAYVAPAVPDSWEPSQTGENHAPVRSKLRKHPRGRFCITMLDRCPDCDTRFDPTNSELLELLEQPNVSCRCRRAGSGRRLSRPDSLG